MPNQAIGVYAKLLVCPEESFKVLPSSTAGKSYLMPFNSVSLSANQNTTDPGTITGRRDAVEAIYGNISNEGDIVAPLDARNVGVWLALAFGNPTTTSAGSGKYKHTFKASQTQPSFAVEKVFNNGVILKSVGCKVSQLQFSFGGDGELTATISVVGCNEVEEQTEFATPKKINMLRYNNFQSSLLIDNVQQQVATEVTCNIDFGIDTEGYAIGGNGYRVRANEGIIKPSGSVTAFFDDNTYLQKALNSTEMALEIDLNSQGNKLQLVMPEVKLNYSTPGIEGATGISQQFDYNAYYGDNDQDACVVFILTNDVNSYEL